jgi:hypothetical protein
MAVDVITFKALLAMPAGRPMDIYTTDIMVDGSLRTIIRWQWLDGAGWRTGRFDVIDGEYLGDFK